MVLVVSMPLVSGGPPTSAAAAGVPFAPSPWHIAHFAAKIGAPCAAVPLPGGRPVPSGRMLMSHAAMSASEIFAPRPGDCEGRPRAEEEGDGDQALRRRHVSPPPCCR